MIVYDVSSSVPSLNSILLVLLHVWLLLNVLEIKSNLNLKYFTT